MCLYRRGLKEYKLVKGEDLKHIFDILFRLSFSLRIKPKPLSIIILSYSKY